VTIYYISCSLVEDKSDPHGRRLYLQRLTPCPEDFCSFNHHHSFSLLCCSRVGNYDNDFLQRS